MFLGTSNAVIGSSILCMLIGGLVLWAMDIIHGEICFSVLASFAIFVGIFGGQGDAFAPVTDEPLRVDTVHHACRLKTDEEGVEAAAYTVEMQKYGMSMNIVEMTFDHPFFFALKTDYDNSIFFAGIVTQP